MSGYSRRSKFQGEKKDQYQFNKGLEDKKPDLSNLIKEEVLMFVGRFKTFPNIPA